MHPQDLISRQYRNEECHNQPVIPTPGLLDQTIQYPVLHGSEL